MKYILLGVSRQILSLAAVISAILPSNAYAQTLAERLPFDPLSPAVLIGTVGAIILIYLLTKMLGGVANTTLIEAEPLDSIEERKPHLPSTKMVLTTFLACAGLFFLSLKTIGGVAPFDGPNGFYHLAFFFIGVAVVGALAQMKWRSAKEYTFAFVVGSCLAFLLLGFKDVLFGGVWGRDPVLMAAVLIVVLLAWRLLFGPWSAHVKATVLGTFILWIAIHLFWKEGEQERLAHLLSIIVALIPAAIWCTLFLEYHIQRRGMVILMFCAGMLSTAPVLFYDALVRRGVEFQFFLIRIVPQSFNTATRQFVNSNFEGLSSLKNILLTTLISFMIVGLIEEVSKFWVLSRSGRRFFSSIDDVIQLSIIVAIGFAFAENVLNPLYFLSFVRDQLILPPEPAWGAFLGNVLGRSILTTMVHILSSGIFGYFLGLAIFAGPYLEESRREGRDHAIAHALHRLLRFPEKGVFRKQVLLIGLLTAVFLHGMFNFLVTLPDILPGNPQTLGDLLKADAGSWLHYISLLLVPSLFYVVGGFWLMTMLFGRDENRLIHGRLVRTDTFVRSQPGA